MTPANVELLRTIAENARTKRQAQPEAVVRITFDNVTITIARPPE
jgi:hypothetical protein